MPNTIYKLQELLNIVNLSFSELTEIKIKAKQNGEESDFSTVKLLEQPILTITNNILYVNQVTNAELYELYIDDIKVLESQTNITYNLSSLTIEPHNIKVLVSASNYVGKENQTIYVSSNVMYVNNFLKYSDRPVLFYIGSDFNFPFEEITVGSDVFIKIPTMYRKVNDVVDDQITSFIISNTQLDSSYQPYPCFLDENGSLLPYILIGKYWISSTSVANSVNATAATMTIGNGRTLCRAKTDASYQGLLYDWQIHQLWRDLIMCVKQTVNTNSGTAWTTDELGIYWGTSNCWIDGLASDSNTIRFSYKPSAYVDSPTSSTTNYNTVNYTMPSSTSGVNIIKLGYDSSHPFVNMPVSASGTSYTIYYCDSYTGAGSNNKPFRAAVGYAAALSGAFNSAFNLGWTYSYACRLCLRPKV